MSLNVKTIRVGDTEVTLRLTSKALLNFNLKHGSEGNFPVIAVLDAINNYSSRIDLFTNALNHPENKNIVKTGDALLDQMADDSTWDRRAVNVLILELAEESGLLDGDAASALIEPIVESDKNMISMLSNLLAGKPIGGAESATEQTDNEENPT